MEHSLKHIYKQIRKISNSSSPELAWDPDNNLIFQIDNEAFCFMPREDVDSVAIILNRLAEQEYIYFTESEYYFRLTFKGLHQYQVRWENSKSFLFRSIVVPIFVAFATALITSLVIK